MTPWRPRHVVREWVRFVHLQTRSSLLRTGAASVQAGPDGIVVTLSSIPSRIGRIFPALNSLLDQTVAPQQIILAVPETSRREDTGYVVPDEIREHPRITVLATERDWGPATKLIPTLRHLAYAPETPVLAVDDDNIYPRTFIETFQHHARAMPHAALSLRGCSVPQSRRWKDCREFKGSSVTSPKRTDVIEGCAGILVRPAFFDDDVFDYQKAPPEAFFVDDVWISGHLARRRVPAYVVPFPGAFVYMPSLVTLKGPRLDRDENRDGRNNDVLLDYFGKDWGWA